MFLHEVKIKFIVKRYFIVLFLKHKQVSNIMKKLLIFPRTKGHTHRVCQLFSLITNLFTSVIFNKTVCRPTLCNALRGMWRRCTQDD